MNKIDKISEYGLEYQIKLLSVILHDKTFAGDIIKLLETNYFESAATRWIIDKIKEYYIKYNELPTDTVFRLEVNNIEDNLLKLSISEHLLSINNKVDSTDTEYIKDSFNEYCQNQKVKTAILTSVDYLKNGEYDKIKSLINDACNVSIKSNEELFTSEYMDMTDEEIEKKDNIQPLINNRFVAKGKSLIITGETHIGKSSFILQALCYWGMGKNYLGYTPTQAIHSLYIGNEDDSIDMKNVFLSINRCDDIPIKEIKSGIDNIYFLKYQHSSKNNHNPYNKSNINDNLFNQIESKLKEYQSKGNPFDVFVINPISNFMSGNLNDIETITGFYNRIEDIMIRYNVSFITISHTNKMNDASRSKLDAIYGMAGSAGFANKFRSSIMISKTDIAGVFKLENGKSKNKAGWHYKYIIHSQKPDIFWKEISEDDYYRMKYNNNVTKDVSSNKILSVIPNNMENAICYNDIIHNTNLSKRSIQNKIKELEKQHPEIKSFVKNQVMFFYKTESNN